MAEAKSGGPPEVTLWLTARASALWPLWGDTWGPYAVGSIFCWHGQSLAACALRSNGEGRARAAGRNFLLSSCFCFISARSSALRNILPNILVFKGHRCPCSAVRFIYYNCVNTLPPFTTQCPLSEPPFSGCVNSLEMKETVFL